MSPIYVLQTKKKKNKDQEQYVYVKKNALKTCGEHDERMDENDITRQACC